MQKRALFFALDATSYAALTPAEQLAINQLPVVNFLLPEGFADWPQGKDRHVAQELSGAELPTPTKQAAPSLLADLLVVAAHPTTTVETAQALGLDTVLWDPTGRYPASATTYTITQLTQLVGVLFGFMPQGGCKLRGFEQCRGTCPKPRYLVL